MNRELSGMYFRMGAENIDWLDTSPDQRTQILKDKSTTFLCHMIYRVRDIYDEICSAVGLEVMHWMFLEDSRDKLLSELERVTLLTQELAETYDLIRK